MKWRQPIFIFFSALVLVGVVLGGLFFGLVWYSDYTAARSEAEQAEIECPEGVNSNLCFIRGFIKPKPPIDEDF